MKRLALALVLAASLASAETIDRATLARVVAIGESYGVPASVSRALVAAESGGDPRAVSQLTPEGYRSYGLCQLYIQPDNIAMLIDRYWHEPRAPKLYDPLDNATIGLAYLADLHRRYGSWLRALRAYNCGSPDSRDRGVNEYARGIVNAH